MRTKVIGFLFLLAIMASVGVIYFAESQQAEKAELSGYVGGEKIGLLEDEEVGKILDEEYRISIDYAKAGSLDMVTEDLEGKDYLFPSSSIALEYYESMYGKPERSEIVFNTPIVLYTYEKVLAALEQQGMVTRSREVCFVDMEKLLSLILEEKEWSDIGLSELYGKIAVDTTDPAKSNSGNMFAALVANVLNGGETLTEADLAEILPKLQEIFGRLGYMETSSADLFSQFLRMGIGAKPIIAGYESQLLEYAVQEPEEYERIKEDVVMLYPAPTVWSANVLIALDEDGSRLIDGMLDEKIQDIGWKQHGFRTGNYSITEDVKEIKVPGVAEDVTSVTPVPSFDVMEKIIEGLS